jgi:hypothetical protein
MFLKNKIIIKFGDNSKFYGLISFKSNKYYKRILFQFQVPVF